MKWIFRGVTMCAVAGFSLLPAAAAPITYEFSVEATSGPLSGTIAGGTFTFDGSIAPPGGGDVFGAGLLNLDFTWDGITYDESTVKGGNIAFDAAGGLTFAFFGSHCDAGGCLLDTGIKSWDVFLELTRSASSITPSATSARCSTRTTPHCSKGRFDRCRSRHRLYSSV